LDGVSRVFKFCNQCLTISGILLQINLVDLFPFFKHGLILFHFIRLHRVQERLQSVEALFGFFNIPCARKKGHSLLEEIDFLTRQQLLGIQGFDCFQDFRIATEAHQRIELHQADFILPKDPPKPAVVLQSFKIQSRVCVLDLRQLFFGGCP